MSQYSSTKLSITVSVTTSTCLRVRLSKQKSRRCCNNDVAERQTSNDGCNCSISTKA